MTAGGSVAGVDFSGAVDCGRRLWVARGTARPGGGVRFDTLMRGEELPDGGRGAGSCFPALVEWLGKLPGGAIAGLDFPFGLPEAIAALADCPPQPGGWTAFVAGFEARFPSADEFRRRCAEAAGGREWKRVTDIANRTPFCPWNLRMYRQTWAGIARVVAPLVVSGRAVGLPMQAPDPGKPGLIEACPASGLKVRGQYAPYKGRGLAEEGRRRALLEWLSDDSTPFAGRCVVPEQLAARALANTGGDALDALLCAEAAARALAAGDWSCSPAEALEAKVFA